jgi:hypothetical protein
VTAPDEWFAAVTPTTRAYLEFLVDRGRLAPGSDSARALLATVDRIGDRVLTASRDPRNFGMAKSIFMTAGFDPSLSDPAGAAIEAFNALPDAERAAVVDPALGRVGPGDVLHLPDLGDLADRWGRPHLPMVWLPPPAELAPAVRAAPLVQDLLQLATWNGSRHKVTRSEVLPLADARHACADLGLPVPPGPLRSAAQIPALARLWSLALDSELLEIARRTAVRGDAVDLLIDPESDPDDVVSWWVRLLDACLADGPDWADEDDEDDEDEDDQLDGDEDEDEDNDSDEDIAEAVDEVLSPLLVELYSEGRTSLDVLEQAVQEMAEEMLASMWVAEGIPENQMRQQTLQRWRAHVAQLVDVGAVTVEDGGLDLTPLGRVGVRAIALDDGGEAPLIDDPAALDADTLLKAAYPLGESVRHPLLAAWSAARRPAQAVDEILEAARRGGTAQTRSTASAVLRATFGDHLRGAGRLHLEALRDDPVFGAYAHLLLTEPGQAPQLPPRLRQWTALEAVAVAVEGGALDEVSPGRQTDFLSALWQIVEEDADLDSAWTSSHPELVDVLGAIAAHHPKGRIRKAAKKALFKARGKKL